MDIRLVFIINGVIGVVSFMGIVDRGIAMRVVLSTTEIRVVREVHGVPIPRDFCNFWFTIRWFLNNLFITVSFAHRGVHPSVTGYEISHSAT